MKFHTSTTKPGIYKITNKTNGKFYIGCASNLQNRYRQHLCTLNNQKGVNTYLQNAWNKYGSENFIFEIIETVEKQNNLKRVLNIKEQYWVNVLNPSYNIRKICVDTNIGLHYKFSEDVKRKFKENAKKGKDNHASIPVVLIDKYGNLVKEFDCGRDCANFLKLSFANITHCCKHKTFSLKNKFISLYKSEWENISSDRLKELLLLADESYQNSLKSISRLNYYKSNKEIHKRISERQKRPIIQFDKLGNKLAEFDSIKDAGKILGMSAGNIGLCCNGKRKTAGNFIFKFKFGGRYAVPSGS